MEREKKGRSGSNRMILIRSNLKAQSCKLYNNKYKIASTQTTNNEILTFIAVLVLKDTHREKAP